MLYIRSSENGHSSLERCIDILETLEARNPSQLRKRPMEDANNWPSVHCRSSWPGMYVNMNYAHRILIIRVIHPQYYPYDYSFYQTILRKWLAWFSDLEIPRRDLFNDDTPEANKIWDDIQRSRSGEKTASKVAFWRKLPYV